MLYRVDLIRYNFVLLAWINRQNAFYEQAVDIFGGAAAKVFLLPQDDIVEHFCRYFAELADVFIAPVTCTCHNAKLEWRFYMGQKFLNAIKACGIMRKVDHETEILKVENIHPARRLRSRRDKCLKR